MEAETVPESKTAEEENIQNIFKISADGVAPTSSEQLLNETQNLDVVSESLDSDDSKDIQRFDENVGESYADADICHDDDNDTLQEGMEAIHGISDHQAGETVRERDEVLDGDSQNETELGLVDDNVEGSVIDDSQEEVLTVTTDSTADSLLQVDEENTESCEVAEESKVDAHGETVDPDVEQSVLEDESDTISGEEKLEQQHELTDGTDIVVEDEIEQEEVYGVETGEENKDESNIINDEEVHITDAVEEHITNNLLVHGDGEIIDHPEDETASKDMPADEAEVSDADEDVEEANIKEENGLELEGTRAALVNRSVYDIEDGKDYQSEILADWNDGGQTPAAVNGCNDQNHADDHENAPESKGDEKPLEAANEALAQADDLIGTLISKRKREGKYNLKDFEISAKDVVNSLATNSKPIVAPKDLFLSIEFAKDAKRAEKAKTVDKKRDEILEILEADDVHGWRQAVPVTEAVKENADDLLIKSEIIAGQAPGEEVTDSPSEPLATPRKPPRRGPLRCSGKDREAERLLALHQLETQFPVRPRKPKGNVEVAVFDLERALSTTPLLGGRKRRPCYLPQPIKADDISSPIAAVKTYTPKRRSLDTKVDIETGLETIAVVNKHLSASVEDSASPTKPEKQKKKIKGETIKKSSELQKLLADEGAVRMLYEAAHRDDPTEARPTPKKKTKKELQQKTKFVQKAVMRLSGVEKTLRRKKLTAPASPLETSVGSVEEPLFAPSSSGTAGIKSRKKPRAAEASKILYRHSSSESFDDSEGIRRTPSEIAGLDKSPDRASVERHPSTTSDATPVRKSSRPRKLNTKFTEWITDTLSSRAKKQEVVQSFVEHIEEFPSIFVKEEVVETAQEVSSSPSPIKTKKKKSPVESQEVRTDTSASRESEPPQEVSLVRQRKKKKAVESLEPDEGVQAPREATPSPVSSRKKKKIERQSEVKVTAIGTLLEICLTSVGPSIKNGVTPEVLIDLRKALEEAEANEDCKAVMLTSTGEPFCQGIDLSLLGPNYDVPRLVNEIKCFLTTFVSFSKPVIAGVHGACVGFGVAILALCDVVVAVENATFYTPYTSLCQGPEGGASVTFPRIGNALVSELIYKCSKVNAEQALSLGLVSQCVPQNAFYEELDRTTEAICAQSAQALSSVKALMTEHGRGAIIEGVERECAALLKSWTSPDCLERIAVFVESGELISNS